MESYSIPWLRLNPPCRLFVKAIGEPRVMQTLTHVGLRSKPLMEWVLKVMANLLEDDEKESGISEAAYRALETVVRRVPTSIVEL